MGFNFVPKEADACLLFLSEPCSMRLQHDKVVVNVLLGVHLIISASGQSVGLGLQNLVRSQSAKRGLIGFPHLLLGTTMLCSNPTRYDGLFLA